MPSVRQSLISVRVDSRMVTPVSPSLGMAGHSSLVDRRPGKR